MAKRDYYEILGVERSASQDEIKRAYRRVAVANHPDKNPGDARAEELFKEATEAYDVLSNQEKRRNYDQFGFAGVQQGEGGGGFDFSHVFREFDDLFGDFSGFFSRFTTRGESGKRSAARRGESLQYEAAVDFKTAVFGGSIEIRYTQKILCTSCEGTGSEPGYGQEVCERCRGSGQVRQSSGFFSINSVCPICRGAGVTISHPCRACRGEGRKDHAHSTQVKIPAGISDGQIIRMRGKGNAGQGTSLVGDLLIVIHVREHKYFMRRNNNLYCVIPVSVTQAVLGASIFIRSLDDKRIKVKIPSGTQNGKMLRIRDEGVPISPSNRGDLYVTLQVQLPKRLNKNMERLWREIASVSDDSIEPAPVAIADLE